MSPTVLTLLCVLLCQTLVAAGGTSPTEPVALASIKTGKPVVVSFFKVLGDLDGPVPAAVANRVDLMPLGSFPLLPGQKRKVEIDGMIFWLQRHGSYLDLHGSDRAIRMADCDKKALLALPFGAFSVVVGVRCPEETSPRNE